MEGDYVDCQSRKNCAYQIMNTAMEENAANRSGGALAWQQVKPELINVTITNNSAYYGQNYASFPTHLEIRSSRQLQKSKQVCRLDSPRE